jgi:hypothetical protein
MVSTADELRLFFLLLCLSSSPSPVFLTPLLLCQSTTYIGYGVGRQRKNAGGEKKHNIKKRGKK